MRLPEQGLYDSLRAAGAISRMFRFHRVENTAIDSMADVWYQNRFGSSGWLELKVLRWPARPNTKPLKENSFEPGQVGWLRATAEWGTRTYVLVRFGPARDNRHALVPAGLLGDAFGLERDEFMTIYGFGDLAHALRIMR